MVFSISKSRTLFPSTLPSTPDMTNTSPVVTETATAAMGAQEYADAVASLEKALAAGGDDLRVHLYLGQSMLALRRYDEALGHLRTALERSPSPEREREIHAARGLAYHGLEQFDRAAEAYRQAGDGGLRREPAGVGTGQGGMRAPARPDREDAQGSRLVEGHPGVGRARAADERDPRRLCAVST